MNTSDPMIGETVVPTPDDSGSKSDMMSVIPDEVVEAPSDKASAGCPVAAPVPDAHAIADRLRAEFSEIATVAAQAARLGIEIDAADAMRRGLKPDALRQTILDRLAVRSEAADVVAIAPQPAPPGESPIVKRARERAAAGR
jgi:hypothetical protein